MNAEQKQIFKEEMNRLMKGIVNESVDIPDNALVTSLHIPTAIFTKKRLELLDAIKLYRPQSVQDLANITDRMKQAVDRDLKLLEKQEVVKLVKKGRITTPIVLRDVVVLTLPREEAMTVPVKKAIRAV